MSEADLASEVAAATAYEQLHVPALFQEWVEPVLDAARVGPGQRVVDIACGTGILARGALDRVGPTGMVCGVDPGTGMLAVAERLAPSAGWKRGTAESLPLKDGSFDAAVSQFGMMFFTDPTGAVGEALRVLNPGGRLAFAVWDSLTNQPAYEVEVALLERLAGSEAADALRAPFVLGDRDGFAAIFEGAGVSEVDVTTRMGEARFPSLRSMVEADLRGWLPVMGVHLPDDLIDEILREAEEALSGFVTTDGEVVFESPAHIVTGARA